MSYAKYTPIIVLLGLALFLALGETYVMEQALTSPTWQFVAQHKHALIALHVALAGLYYKYYLVQPNFDLSMPSLPSYDEATSTSMSSSK